MGPARSERAREDVRVLVGLPRIRLDALQDLVVGAHRFVNVQMRVNLDISNYRGTVRPSRDRAD